MPAPAFRPTSSITLSMMVTLRALTSVMPSPPTPEEFKSGGDFHPPGAEEVSPPAPEPTLADVAPPPSYDTPRKAPA